MFDLNSLVTKEVTVTDMQPMMVTSLLGTYSTFCIISLHSQSRK